MGSDAPQTANSEVLVNPYPSTVSVRGRPLSDTQSKRNPRKTLDYPRKQKALGMLWNKGQVKKHVSHMYIRLTHPYFCFPCPAPQRDGAAQN